MEIFNIHPQCETKQEPNDREPITAIRAKVSVEEVRNSDDQGAGHGCLRQ